MSSAKQPPRPHSSNRPTAPGGGPATGLASSASTVRCLAAALFALTVLLFARAIGNDFVNYDDPDYVTANPHVKAGLSGETIRWAFRSTEASNWHPLTWLSHLADVSLFGLDPRGHHATNVLLHALTASLVFVVLRRMTGALWTSAIGAALFAWHPLRVESVAWVSERKDVLSGLFWWLGLWAYAAYVSHRRGSTASERARAARFYWLTVATFALGLMAKPMLVTFPCVLLLLDVWPLRRFSFARSRTADGATRESVAAATDVGRPAESDGCVWREKLPFFVLVIASAVVTYVAQSGGGSVAKTLSFPLRLENAVVAVLRYLGKIAWPVDLAVLYPHPGAWPVRVVIFAAAVLVGVTAFAVAWRRRRPWFLIGWLWFIGVLVPVSGLVQVGLQSMADRYTYLPVIGLELALLWTIRERVVSIGGRRAAAAIAVVALLGCAAQTWRQLAVWKNSFTLFDHAIASTDRNYVAHDNRGLFLFHAGRIEEAMADYQRSLAINPGYLNAHNNLGYALAQLGRTQEALPEYRAALAANPQHLEVRNNLANALADLGHLPEAMEHYAFVLARAPRHVNALNGSAVALAMQNRPDEARARLELALQVDPQNASAHNNLGNVCAMLGRRDEAVAHYRRAAELSPTDPHPLLLAGLLLSEAGKVAEAAEQFQHAIARRAVNPDAHAQLGIAYARLGRREDARRELQIALQQRPGYPDAQRWLDAVSAAR